MVTAIEAVVLQRVRDAHAGVGFLTGCVGRDNSEAERGLDGMTLTAEHAEQVTLVMFDLARELAARDGDGADPSAVRDYLEELAEGERRRVMPGGEVWVGWPNLRLATS
ncbi:hypothetical protein [Nocardia terpenica]|uniref:Uncharacterized protein n=1 Tax=Nocardia terpenica TaxID=455432 RepID=A0A164H9L8_9NOCA|nr:hypothetical protein [Nocardia terpenica]KZM68318.1 hypothetical protein AWN90_10515 [Nocardia terpenica]NQE88775.1 hypothetical protein [Nocardia terpenica]